MLKELLLAILLGIFLGFGVTGSFMGIKKIAQKQLNTPKISIPTTAPKPSGNVEELTLPVTEPTSKQQEPSSASLIINQPQPNSISETEDMVILGKTLPNSTVMVQNQKDDVLTTSDKDGQFEIKVKLAAGMNYLKITSIQENENFTQTLPVTYSNAKF